VILWELKKQVDKMRNYLADMITRIRNGQKANLKEIILFWPFPKKYLQFLILLEKEGVIRGFKKIILKNKEFFIILLKYNEFQNPLIKKIELISKPGKRVFCKSKNFWNLKNGKGFLIISSNLGYITDHEARTLNLGGEILCYVE
jgi:small subunit ribosomal protein S8